MTAPAAMLVGRSADLNVIDDLLDSRARRNALLVTGDPGVGKSALLEASAKRARNRGYQVLRAAGNRFTAEAEYSCLSDLLGPKVNTALAVDEPLRDALGVVLGVRRGGAPTPLLAASAALAGFAALAAQQPVAVVVDDLHWLDEASARTLSFVARRAGNGVKFLGATNTGSPFWSGTRLPWHHLRPLSETAGAELMDALFPALTARTQRRLLAEARGNPLALLELARAVGEEPLAGAGTAVAWPVLDEPLRSMYVDRIRALPPATRQTLLLAALNSGGELSVLSIAAQGAVLSSLAPAERDGLVSIRPDGHTVAFSHPMIRSTVVELAHDLERRKAHHALAIAVRGQPEREATHLADACIGPDAHVADLLEDAARSSMTAGDPLRALDLMVRSSRLSVGSADRSRRMIQAATLRAEVTGDLGAASETLAAALIDEPGLTESLAATLAAVHVLTNAECRIDVAYDLLVTALNKHSGDEKPCDATLLDALHTLIIICWMRGGGPQTWRPVESVIERLGPDASTLLTSCLATLGDPARGDDELIRCVDALVDDLSNESDPVVVIRVHLACVYLDRVGHCREALKRVIRDGRDGGAVALAISALVGSAVDDWQAGRWAEAHAAVTEGVLLATQHGYRRYSFVLGDYIGALVAAARGDGDRSAAAAASLATLAAQTGTEIAGAFAHHLLALSASARGDFDSAFLHSNAISAAGQLAPYAPHALWVLFDLVEAAMKTNRVEQGRAHVDAMRRANIARLSSRLALIYTACAAMTGPSDEARAMFDKALAIPGASRWQFDYARVQLAYAEHLRSRQSLTEASRHFDVALRTFEGLAAEPWAARAAKGLRATHASAQGWRGGAARQLSARDRQIAMLAAAGLTNREIGERLHMSHRTVGGHLYRIFPMLGVTSRAALHAALVELTDEHSAP